MRLIDAELLESQFGVSDEDILAKEEIRFAPTVDATPVVYCKDCKYYDLWADGRSMNRCDKHECTMYDEDFCSYGERRDKP